MRGKLDDRRMPSGFIWQVMARHNRFDRIASISILWLCFFSEQNVTPILERFLTTKLAHVVTAQ